MTILLGTALLSSSLSRPLSNDLLSSQLPLSWTLTNIFEAPNVSVRRISSLIQWLRKILPLLKCMLAMYSRWAGRGWSWYRAFSPSAMSRWIRKTSRILRMMNRKMRTFGVRARRRRRRYSRVALGGRMSLSVVSTTILVSRCDLWLGGEGTRQGPTWGGGLPATETHRRSRPKKLVKRKIVVDRRGFGRSGYRGKQHRGERRGLEFEPREPRRRA